jgi:non-specific serine/threonine protein kinase
MRDITSLRATTFGELLHSFRLAAGLTQAQLAERAGLSARGISDLERGLKQRPRKDTLDLLIAALELPTVDQVRLRAAVRWEGPHRRKEAAVLTLAPRPAEETTNLPIQATSFIGRAAEVAGLRELVLGADVRLVTITGPGGIGKTRLALHVAAGLSEAFPSGIWLVGLAPLANPDLVPQTLAAVVGLQLTGGTSWLNALSRYLRDRQCLLILDNCEHLVDAVAELCATLLAGCPHLRLLATSRETLRIAGERSWPVPPLSVPAVVKAARDDDVADVREAEAVQLFAERAQALAPGFAVTVDNAETVARICQRLDGIPLAIELAAARLPSLSLPQLAARLGRQLRLLTGGSRTAPDRQQTLRATIDWSYAHLSLPEQVVLHRLAVFAGGATLEAAEAVCADEGDEPGTQNQSLASVDVLDLLASLVAKSLVQTDDAHGERRYRLLEAVREFAGEKLEQSGELRAVRDRHRDWFLALAERAEPHFTSGEQVSWLDRCQIERDNFRAALTWCDESGRSGMGLKLAAALQWFWYVRDAVSEEGIAWLSRFLASTTVNSSPQSRARALTGLGLLYFSAGDPVKALAALEEARGICERTNNRRELARFHYLIPYMLVRGWDGDLSGAFQHFLEGAILAREVGDRWALAQALDGLGWVCRGRREDGEARRYFAESLSIFRACQDWRAVAYSLYGLGWSVFHQGDLAEARRFFEEALALNREVGAKMRIPLTLHALAEVIRVAGDGASARVLLEECLTLARENGQNSLARDAWVDLGWIARKAKDWAQARAYALDAMAPFRSEPGEVSVWNWIDLARVLLCDAGRYQMGARLFGLVDSHRPLPWDDAPAPDIQTFFNESVDRLRRSLEGSVFAALCAEGSAMTLEQAIAGAMADLQA